MHCTAVEGRTLQADDAPDWDGPDKMAGGAIGESASLMAVDEAMGVPASDVDGDEAGGHCGSDSHPYEGVVTGRAQDLSASEIWSKKANCLNYNSYPSGNIQKRYCPKTTTKTHLQWQCDAGLGNNVYPASANCFFQLNHCVCLNFTENPRLVSSC